MQTSCAICGRKAYLINGHSIRPDGCPPAAFAAWAEAAGLELVEHWSTWEQDAFVDGSEYSLTVHRLVD